MCGTTLQSSASVRVVPAQLEQEIRTANQSLTSLLQNIRSQVRDLQTATNNTGDQLQQLRHAWQAVPAEAMDPQQAASRSRPTAKATLERLPRITLEEGSLLFHQATVVVDGREFSAILGEFGDWSASNPTKTEAGAAVNPTAGKLIVANPTTGMGGLNNSDVMKSNIVYMERGDGLTFCEKALMAQEAGAAAVVIGNHTPEPWPYVMKDSNGEAASLQIPVVMVKQSDGHVLFGLEGKECSLNLSENKNECVVCRDHFEVPQIVIRLPACGHTFHEKCALTWLTHHNACPYCRRELPTDDVEYEQERRRTQRTHAGSVATASSEWHDLYG
jgi:hypothetical protein